MANCEPHIQWMWQGYGDCFKLFDCILHVVEVGPPPILRGTTSPHGCVENAVRSAREGNNTRAIRWLQAGQAHNPDAQRCFAVNSQEVIAYLLAHYGPHVPNLVNFNDAFPVEESVQLLKDVERLRIDTQQLFVAQIEATGMSYEEFTKSLTFS